MTYWKKEQEGDTLVAVVGADSYSIASASDPEPDGYTGSLDLRGWIEITAEEASDLLGYDVYDVICEHRTAGSFEVRERRGGTPPWAPAWRHDASPKTLAVGDVIWAGRDRDRGRVVAIEDNMITVGWITGVTTTQPIDALEDVEIA